MIKSDKFWYFLHGQIYQIPRISDLSRSRLISGTRWLRVTRWLKCQVRLAVRDESRIYPIMNRKSLLSNLSVEIPLKIWALQLDFYNWIDFTFNSWLIEMSNWKWLIRNESFWTVWGTLVIVEKGRSIGSSRITWYDLCWKCKERNDVPATWIWQIKTCLSQEMILKISLLVK